MRDGVSDRRTTADAAGRQTCFLSDDEVSHLVERGRRYPDLESFTEPGVVNIWFYLGASPVIGTLVESVLGGDAELFGPVRLANLSLYRGVLSGSGRVRLLGECTVARVHEILHETKL